MLSSFISLTFMLHAKRKICSLVLLFKLYMFRSIKRSTLEKYRQTAVFLKHSNFLLHLEYYWGARALKLLASIISPNAVVLLLWSEKRTPRLDPLYEITLQWWMDLLIHYTVSEIWSQLSKGCSSLFIKY